MILPTEIWFMTMNEQHKAQVGLNHWLTVVVVAGVSVTITVLFGVLDIGKQVGESWLIQAMIGVGERMSVLGQPPLAYVMTALLLGTVVALMVWAVKEVPYNHGGRL